MSDEAEIVVHKPGAGLKAVIQMSPYLIVVVLAGAIAYVRSHDLERLQNVDSAGLRRDEVNGRRIDSGDERLSQIERDQRAERDRIIRLEVAAENQAKSLDKIETGVERLNVKVDEIRRKAGQ